MIRVTGDPDELYTLRVSGDIDATFQRCYRDGELLAFSDGTVIRAHYRPTGYGLWRLTPALSASPLRFTVVDEWADPPVDDSCELDADITFAVALAQPGAARFPDAPPEPEPDLDDELGYHGGPWTLEVQMGPGPLDLPARTHTRALDTLRQAMHEGLHASCTSTCQAVTVRGADGHVAAMGGRHRNIWLNVTDQARHVDAAFHRTKDRERRR